jgi:MoxR-like ATPase
MVRVSLGYPAATAEAEMLAEHAGHDRVLDVEPVADVAELLAAQEAAARVAASEPVRRYVVALLDRTRRDARTELGASPRAGLMLLKAAMARAVLEGRDHVLPDDIQDMAQSVLAHRLMLSSAAVDADREQVVRDALDGVPAL